jgi:hypothetical protein
VNRFTVANMLVLVGFLGVGMAAMRDGSELAERIVFTLMTVALVVALIGALARRRNGAWAGFAVCGWGYAALAFVSPIRFEFGSHLLGTAPLDAMLDSIVTRLHPIPSAPAPPMLSNQFMSQLPRGFHNHEGNVAEMEVLTQLTDDSITDLRKSLSSTEQRGFDTYLSQLRAYDSSRASIIERRGNAERVSRSILVLCFALLGAILGRFVASWRTRPMAETRSVNT